MSAPDPSDGSDGSDATEVAGADDVFWVLEHAVLTVLPARADDLSRLRALAAQAGPATATVTVVGKYNHGKSRLLNELLRQDAFAVADRRETVRLDERMVAGVRWLDAPGLDADVGGADDGLSRRAVWQQSDIRLFVHSAGSGELDAQECDLLRALQADQHSSRRQTLLVITQIDQTRDDAELRQVGDAVAAQVPGMDQHRVSATRHRRGAEGGKRSLVDSSGIPALEAALRLAVQAVPQARAFEFEALTSGIRDDLRQRRAQAATRLDALVDRRADERRQFEHDLAAVLRGAPDDLADVLSDPGPDLALRPDAVDDRFRATVGRMERARVQVAYSRLCIKLKAVLVRHGAFDLPPSQHTVSASLNSAMVAVLGVSVKYRADLRRMFCQDAGRERLLQDFARYFERSPERMTLAAEVEAARQLLAAVARATLALASAAMPPEPAA
ncbi:hypothetical protein GN316_07030 [Xylophilus sp. Kf1]|nr:hypothetical protein [Xylophilus sp. Kf1]